MEDKDYIKDLFKDQLDGFEADVRPDLWNAISSQLPVSSPVSTGGLTWLTKSLIIAASAAVVGVTVYMVSINESNRKEVKKETTTTSENKVDIVSTEQKESPVTTENILPKVVEQDVINIQSVVQTSVIDHLTVPVFQQLNSYLNNNADILPFVENTANNTNKVEVTTRENEQEKVELAVQPSNEAEEKAVQQEKLYTLVDPVNVFTPNNDGVNDFFELPSSGLEEFSIVVLDARNKTVFSSSDPQFRWDGTLSGGEQLPSGNYIYYLTARDKKGNPVTQSSYLRIVR